MHQSLYISRRVINAENFDTMCRCLGLAPKASYHTTLAFSTNAVDWDRPVFQCDPFELELPLRDARLDLLGPARALVLRFSSPILTARNAALLRAGIQTSHDGFIPHITLAKSYPDPLPQQSTPLPTFVRLGAEKRRIATTD